MKETATLFDKYNKLLKENAKTFNNSTKIRNLNYSFFIGLRVFFDIEEEFDNKEEEIKRFTCRDKNAISLLMYLYEISSNSSDELHRYVPYEITMKDISNAIGMDIKTVKNSIKALVEEGIIKFVDTVDTYGKITLIQIANFRDGIDYKSFVYMPLVKAELHTLRATSKSAYVQYLFMSAMSLRRHRGSYGEFQCGVDYIANALGVNKRRISVNNDLLQKVGLIDIRQTRQGRKTINNYTIVQ